MSDSEIIEFIERLAQTYDDWKLFMQYGKERIIGTADSLAFELVVREAERRRIDVPDTHELADVVLAIFVDLGWKMKVAA